LFTFFFARRGLAVLHILQSEKTTFLQKKFLQEKAVHGFLIATAILFTPAWVLSHIKEYRSPKGAAEE
jgi:hypothetical protein